MNASTQTSGELIYAVDDETMLLDLVRMVVEPLGCTVETFRDPAVALEAFIQAAHKPELIITDYSMRPMNGSELIAACRHIVPGQRFLMLTGTVDEAMAHEAFAAPDRFMAKPYQANQLAEVVREMLKEARELRVAT
jgi:DNA-binding NtrC family response regulator